ncbi:hypothetical protein GGI20_002618 [Coemansia sp. BCRC 34301]|nr:hypothetical protein GGI20_002618 [Coemansia sp. BCRC 34301]
MNGYHTLQQQQQHRRQQQQQQQADNDLAALNEFLAASSAVVSAQQSRQQTANVDDQTMAALLASASGAYTDPQVLALSGPTSPLALASVGVTPSQSMQASHLGDMSSEAAGLSAAGLSAAYTTDSSCPMFSQPLSSFDTSLTALLGTASHSPYSASSSGGVLDIPVITEQRPSDEYVTPLPSNYDQLGFVLGKRKAVEFDDGLVTSARGVPLSKRVSMPAYYGDRSTATLDNSSMPAPTGVGMQRILSYHPDRVSAANISPDLLSPFSILSGNSSASMPGAVNPSSLQPISRFSSNVSTSSLSGQLQESSSAPAPHQQRKVAHNAIERRYRNNINDRICDLRNAVPALQHVRSKKKAHIHHDSSNVNSSDDDNDDCGDEGDDNAEDGSGSANVDGVAAATKLNKATILGKSTEYIYYLRRSNDQLKRESLYLQELVRSSFPGSESIVARVLERAKQESAVATVLLRPPEKIPRPSKKK